MEHLFASFNDDTAKRDFFGFCGQVQNQYLAEDLELYYLGEFEANTGEVFIENDKPVFVVQFGVMKNE